MSIRAFALHLPAHSSFNLGSRSRARVDRRFIPTPKPLPSDSTVREDMLQLAAGDSDKAQVEKVRMENEQRHDKKLRKASGKSDH